MKRIALEKIVIDGGTQFRATINETKVSEYVEMFTDSKAWPFDSACDVFFDGTTLYLVDGFHRFMAAKRAERKSLECNVTEGTLRDAITFALSANARHGLHRSNEDKRKAVAYALADAEWQKLSSRAIAELCGVSDMFVGSVRKESGANGLHLKEEKRIGKDGKPQAATKPKPDPKPEPIQDVWEDVPDEETVTETEPSPQALSAPIQAVATQVTGILKELKRLADHVGGEWLDLTDLETQITALKYSIRQSIYWMDCMDCEGKGCKTCHKHGWLSLDRKKHLTQEQKDKVGV